MHQIPETLIVSGLLYQLKPTDDGNTVGVDHTKSEIRYLKHESQDRTVTELLGMVMTIMLDASGVIPEKGGKISIDTNQLIRVLRHNLFCFLRDNPVDWRMVSLRLPLLVQQTELPKTEEPVVETHQPAEETLEQTTESAISEINRMEFQDEPDAPQ